MCYYITTSEFKRLTMNMFQVGRFRIFSKNLQKFEIEKVTYCWYHGQKTFLKAFSYSGVPGEWDIFWYTLVDIGRETDNMDGNGAYAASALMFALLFHKTVQCSGILCWFLKMCRTLASKSSQRFFLRKTIFCKIFQVPKN